jgi:branched-chain amino acid transport system ATP-binding protein
MADGVAAPVLSARGLRKEFAGFVAVRDVDIDVHDGQIKALIGPNGAGKSTVFNLLTKFLKPTAGRIEFLGQDITGLDPAKVARLGLVRSFQISAVFPYLSCSTTSGWRCSGRRRSATSSGSACARSTG